MIILDITGAILSLLSVYLFTRAHVHAWPVSILANATNAVLYARTGIYGHMSLEFIYIVVNLGGWYYWWQQGYGAQQTFFGRMSRHEWLYHFIIAIALIPLVASGLTHYFSSDIPLLDAVTTVMNFSALIMQCRGRVESWIGWFVVDSIYIIIYAYKGLPFHILQMLIYLVLAVRGYYQWLQMADAKQTHHKPTLLKD